MTASKTGTGTETSQPSQECCMCGDFGLSYELFSCKVCQFRSQHGYCSNIYPKAEAYRVCNWCLSEKVDTAEKTQSSLISSSPNRNSSEDDDKSKRKKNWANGNNGGLKTEKGSSSKLHLNHLIKKQRSLPERSSPVFAPRKRITTIGAMQEKLRRTRSEEISNRGMIRKHVFRNKVRRYKLLDEVTTQ